MRRPLPWIKLWTDILHKPKMRRLTAIERCCWYELLALAQESPKPGKLLLTPTIPLTLDDIALALHLSPDERPALDSMVSKMIELDSLAWNSETLTILKFDQRQEVYPSDIFRIRSASSPHSLRNDSAIAPREGEGEEEGEEDREEDREEDKAQVAPTVSVSAPASEVGVLEIHEEAFGSTVVSPRLMETFAKIGRFPLDEVREAYGAARAGPNIRFPAGWVLSRLENNHGPPRTGRGQRQAGPVLGEGANTDEGAEARKRRYLGGSLGKIVERRMEEQSLPRGGEEGADRENP